MDISCSTRSLNNHGEEESGRPIILCAALPDRRPAVQEPREAVLLTRKDPEAVSPQRAKRWAPCDTLQTRHFYHPLEQTHILFRSSALESVPSELHQAFRHLSCQATFEMHRLVAFCRTMEGVEFQVAIYSSRDDASRLFWNSSTARAIATPFTKRMLKHR